MLFHQCPKNSENCRTFQKDRDDDEKLIVAFCDEESREGRAMFKLLSKIADENSEHAGMLMISLIDPGTLGLFAIMFANSPFFLLSFFGWDRK